jgi:hypothetical protein
LQTGKVFSKTASINPFLDRKRRNVDLNKSLVMKLQHVFVIKNTVALYNVVKYFEMCCMGKPVFYVLFYVITEGVFKE